MRTFVEYQAPWDLISFEVDGLEWAIRRETGQCFCYGPMETTWSEPHQQYFVEADYQADAEWFLPLIKSIPLRSYATQLRAYRAWQDLYK